MKPFVIKRATLSPFLSNRAFVATVVPIRIELICFVGILSYLFNFTSNFELIILLIPSVGASA